MRGGSSGGAVRGLSGRFKGRDVGLHTARLCSLEIARERGALTVLAVVDAVTRLAGRLEYAGNRSEGDAKASALLALAA
ncbi:MAG: hypothetical protein JSU86_13130 [Phycisphaerales bacterium]|nr:MAG: hypothetical protein JSU86_13130 [Phycisphaerales bacterium]